MPMKLTVNGAPHEHAGDGSIDALLREVGAHPQRTAVMVNGEVVPAAERDAIRLVDGDDVELLVFAGGG